jgi:hypothetical protein
MPAPGKALRVLALVGFAACGASPAAMASDSAPCADPDSDSGGAPAHAPRLASAQPARVAPEALGQRPAGARLVDIRRPAGAGRWRPDGALAMSYPQLRVLAGSSEGAIDVFGHGYDEARIMRRIARWTRSEAEKIRVVQNGAAGLALARAESLDTTALKRLLAVPAEQLPGLSGSDRAIVAWAGSSRAGVEPSGRTAGLRVVGFRNASEVTRWAREVTSERDPTIVLAGDDPARLGEWALRSSIALGAPVFFIDADRAGIEQQLARHARLVDGRDRVGSAPCP